MFTSLFTDKMLLNRIRGKYLLTTTINSLNELQSRNQVRVIRILNGLSAKLSTHSEPVGMNKNNEATC